MEGKKPTKPHHYKMKTVINHYKKHAVSSIKLHILLDNLFTPFDHKSNTGSM